MNQHTDYNPSEILLHLSMEEDPGKETLDRYLNEYPELAEDLVELSREMLSEKKSPPVTKLRPEDQALIAKAWQRFQAGIAGADLDPFGALTIPQQREIATSLGISRSTLSAIRDRVVLESTIPRAFLSKLASQIKSSFEDLSRFLATPPTIQQAHSYKADEKPQISPQIAFEELLRQTKTPQELIEKLLTED